MLYPAVRYALTNGSLVKYIICHSEIFVNFLFVEATVQIFVHVLRYTKAGGVYMSTYEKLQLVISVVSLIVAILTYTHKK